MKICIFGVKKMKVLVAMSGGVDSCTALKLLKDEGYECMGCTMLLTPGNEEEARKAAKTAESLGVEHITVDLCDEFKKCVIDRFVSDYESGKTPNPCIECNRCLKFGKLFDIADKYGCDYVATGHYAGIVCEDDEYKIKKADNPAKDQSYVLYTLSQEKLKRIILPLASYDKQQIRSIASESGMDSAKAAESQDICFVPDGDYVSVLKEYSGREYPEGEFVDMQGKVLGRHKGIINYTIGQRRGLNLPVGERIYVCRIDAAKNQVVLGSNEQLFTREFDVEQVSFTGRKTPCNIGESFTCSGCIRYHGRECEARVTLTSDTTLHVELKEPLRAVTPGQSFVMYRGLFLLGGGIIL